MPPSALLANLPTWSIAEGGSFTLHTAYSLGRLSSEASGRDRSWKFKAFGDVTLDVHVGVNNIRGVPIAIHKELMPGVLNGHVGF